ncbi:MAG: AMP-binding protein [Saprospiraceae bacterium]|nr:AMP-binding protein [Saprospiraceae bacterium]
MSESRIWQKIYPPGVPAEIDPETYQNLVDFFEECLSKNSDKIAFECMGKSLSYGQLNAYSTQFGAYLHSRGLVPGDKIALMMPNCLQYPIAIIGALKAGLIVVNTNPLYTPREMLYQFQDSEVKAILILENFAHNLEQIIKNTRISIVMTTSIGEMLGAIKGTIVNFVVRKVKKMVPAYHLDNTVCFLDALKAGKNISIKPFENKPDDVIIHQYTGGTTGISKGAMLTNRNLISNMLQMKQWMSCELKFGEEIALSPLPMYHIFAFTVNCLAMIALGAKTVLVTNAKDIPSVIKEFKKNEISLFSGLNTLFNAMLNHPDFAGQDFSGLKVTVSGGMALQKAVAERWESVTGCRISEGYGMTESSPVITVNIFGKNARLGYIGLPVPSTDVKIVDDDGNEVPNGIAGELIAKGPQIMKGYYRKPEETANTVKDGWLYTGDIAIQEPDGYFRIVDRKKDMILVSGFNVYPNEIEDVLVTHPKILEAAAIGVQDEKSGEAVKVFIVKRDPSLTEEEVMTFAKENFTGYKLPRSVEFRNELPKTNVGKILRRELR